MKRQYDEASTIHRQARRVYALAKEDSSYAKECCELTYKALDSTFRVILTFYDVSYDDCKDIKDLFEKVIDKTAIAASSGNDDFNKNLDIILQWKDCSKSTEEIDVRETPVTLALGVCMDYNKNFRRICDGLHSYHMSLF